MDYDLVFGLIDKANKQDKLKKITKLNYYLNNQIIEPNQIKKKIKKVKKVFFKFRLNDYDYLFFKDYPLNVLINLGFVVGESTQIYEVVLMSGSKYYTIEEYIDFIKEDIRVVNKVSSEIIKHKIYSFDFKQPKFIRTLKNYYEENFERNLSQIFFLKNNDVFRTFCPNLYNRDFEIAKKLNLPIIKYVDNNFIKDSKIHIKDFISIIDRISPYDIIEENQKVRLDKKTNKEVFRDVSREYYLKVDDDEIYNKIKNSYFYNISSLRVFKNLKSHKQVRITNVSGNFKAPIWISDKKYMTFSSISDFENVSGLKFSEDNLEGAFLISQTGLQVDFDNKFLRDIFYRNDGFKVYFKKIDDLVLSVFFCDKKISEVVFLENRNENKERELFNLSRVLLKILILKSIEFNKIPTQEDFDLSNDEMESRDFLFEYLNSIKSHLSFYLEKFETENKYEDVINFFVKKGVFLMKLRNFLRVRDLVIFAEIFYLYLKLVKGVNYDFYYNLLGIFEDFFKKIKIGVNVKLKIKSSLESVFEDFIQFSNCKFHIFFKKEFFSLKDTNYVEIESLTEYESYYKLNKKKVLEDFPKNYLSIKKYFEDFTQFDLKHTFDNNKGVFNYKNLSLDKSYFVEYKKFYGYKTVCDNEFFLILK